MIEALLKGLLLGLLLSISVGPVIFAIIKQSINNGVRGGMSFIVGVSFSDATLVILSNTFTEIVNQISQYEKYIGIGGCTLLVSLGIYVLFFKKIKVNPEGLVHINFNRNDAARIFLSGFLMNTLNPGVIAFWLTWATAFAAMKFSERVALFAICLITILAFDILKVAMADKIRKRLNLKTIRVINHISGAVLIGFGLVLLYGLVIYRA